MNNQLIDEHRKIIHENGKTISIQELKTSMDVFSSVLKQYETADNKFIIMEQIMLALINLPQRQKILTDSELITHELFTMIRDNMIIDQLHRKQTEDTPAQNLLLDATILFMNLSHNIDHRNIVEFKNFVFHKPLIDEIANCLQDMGNNGKYLSDPILLRSLRSLLTIFKNIIKSQITNDDYAAIAPIFFAVIECLSSSYAIEMIKSLKQNLHQKLDEGQTLFLDIMPWYLQWYSDYRDPENFMKILRKLLNQFTQWITSCSPDSYRDCTYKVGAMLRHLTYLLVRPIEVDNISIFSEEFYHDYCKLVLQWSFFLSCTLASPLKNNQLSAATQTIVQILYNFTLHLNVLNFMKTIPNLIPMLLEMTDTEHDEIQLNAYRCLGKIMVEDDIKTMANPGKIACVYKEYIKNTIDDSGKIERFYSLLKSLKSKLFGIVLVQW